LLKERTVIIADFRSSRVVARWSFIGSTSYCI